MKMVGWWPSLRVTAADGLLEGLGGFEILPYTFYPTLWLCRTTNGNESRRRGRPGAS